LVGTDMPPLELDTNVSRTTYINAERLSGRKRALFTNSDTGSSSTQRPPTMNFFCSSFLTKTASS
jgi:hypothetical protein